MTANEAQRAAWDGRSGEFWTEQADRFDRGVAAYDAHLARAAAVAPGERVLDVGCGTGATTRAAARRAGPDGRVVGVDLSGPMLALARERTPMPTVDYVRADAQTHRFAPSSYDVVVSRHGTMFFDDPVAACANLARALRPGGRLAVLVWRALEHNPFITDVLDALTPDRDTPLPPDDGRPGPVSWADPDRVRALLTDAGFVEVDLDAVAEPMVLGVDPDDALAFQTGQHAGLLADLDRDVRVLALRRLHEDLFAHHDPRRGVRYPSACWLVTARRDAVASDRADPSVA